MMTNDKRLIIVLSYVLSLPLSPSPWVMVIFSALGQRGLTFLLPSQSAILLQNFLILHVSIRQASSIRGVFKPSEIHPQCLGILSYSVLE